MSKSSDHNDLFVDGPVDPSLIMDQVQQQSADKRAGACQFFLGQVRDDEIEGEQVNAIEYTAYRSMAEKEYGRIRREIFDTYPVRHLVVYHSLGLVEAGQTSLFVLVTAEHREAAFRGCRDTIQLIKENLPVWGKEITGDGSYTWKENKENL